jgi:hypothetical protein
VLKNKQVLKNILGVVKEGGEERKVAMMWKVAWLKQASTGGKTSQLGRVKGFLVWEWFYRVGQSTIGGVLGHVSLAWLQHLEIKISTTYNLYDQLFDTPFI